MADIRAQVSADTFSRTYGRAALPSRPELGRSSSFALPCYETSGLRGLGVLVAGFYKYAAPAALGCALLLSFLPGCSPEKPRDQAPPAPSQSAAPAPPSWPIFRGNPALTGVANDNLPEKPALLWTFKTGGPVKSSAVIGDGLIFIGSEDGNVYALKFSEGKQVWAFKADSAVEAPPLLAGNSVFVGSMEGWFYALDAGAGRLLWKVQTGDKILASANVVPRPNGPARILFGSYDFKLRCLDAEKGTTNWLFESGYYINGACAVADGRAVFGGCDSMVRSLELDDGKEISQIEAGAYIGASVALAGNRAYFGDYESEFHCADLAGTNMVWHFHGQDAPFLSSAAVNGGLRRLRRRRQNAALPQPRGWQSPLELSDAGQNPKLPGHRRRQSGLRLRGRADLSAVAAGRTAALELRHRTAGGQFPRRGRKQNCDWLRRWQRLLFRRKEPVTNYERQT